MSPLGDEDQSTTIGDKCHGSTQEAGQCVISTRSHATKTRSDACSASSTTRPAISSPLPAVFPDNPAPVVRVVNGERELTMMR